MLRRAQATWLGSQSIFESESGKLKQLRLASSSSTGSFHWSWPASPLRQSEWKKAWRRHRPRPLFDQRAWRACFSLSLVAYLELSPLEINTIHISIRMIKIVESQSLRTTWNISSWTYYIIPNLMLITVVMLSVTFARARKIFWGTS